MTIASCSVVLGHNRRLKKRIQTHLIYYFIVRTEVLRKICILYKLILAIIWNANIFIAHRGTQEKGGCP